MNKFWNKNRIRSTIFIVVMVCAYHVGIWLGLDPVTSAFSLTVAMFATVIWR